MKIHNQTLKYKTNKFMDFIDITDDIVNIVKGLQIDNGLLIIYSMHTTAAVRVNEKEKGIYKDFEMLSKKILPHKQYYHHNDLNIRTENVVCSIGATDCLNGHSHCLHLLMGGTSETIPIINHRVVLGTYQRIFLIELDGARQRKLVIQIISDS